MSCPSHATVPQTTTDIPEVRVNGTLIAADDIAREVQYHPAQSPEDGLRKAAEALVIRTLLLQKAKEVLAEGDEVLSEESLLSVLLEQEAPAELPSKEECLRYFDSHRESFQSPDLLQHPMMRLPCSVPGKPPGNCCHNYSVHRITLRRWHGSFPPALPKKPAAISARLLEDRPPRNLNSRYLRWKRGSPMSPLNPATAYIWYRWTAKSRGYPCLTNRYTTRWPPT